MNWKPVDVIVLVLTLTIALVLLTATVAPLVTGIPYTQEKADLLAQVVHSVVLIISGFVMYGLGKLKNDGS